MLADITLKAVPGLHPHGFLRTSAVAFYLSSSTWSQSVSHSLAINTLPGLKAGSEPCKGRLQRRRSLPGSTRAVGTGWGGRGHFTGLPVGPFEIFGSHPTLIFWPHCLPSHSGFPTVCFLHIPLGCCVPCGRSSSPRREGDATGVKSSDGRPGWRGEVQGRRKHPGQGGCCCVPCSELQGTGIRPAFGCFLAPLQGGGAAPGGGLVARSAGRGWRSLPTAVVVEACKSIDCADLGNHCCLSCGASAGQSGRGQLGQGRSSRGMGLSSASREAGGAGVVLSLGGFFPGTGPTLAASCQGKHKSPPCTCFAWQRLKVPVGFKPSHSAFPW